MPRISCTWSRAATKCISDVPGFMKHTSTSAPTSVRIRAWAPFIGVPSIEDGAGVQDAGRVEGRLDPSHELELGRVLDDGQVRLLLRADAVLAGHRPAQRHPRGEDLVHRLLASVTVGLED